MFLYSIFSANEFLAFGFLIFFSFSTSLPLYFHLSMYNTVADCVIRLIVNVSTPLRDQFPIFPFFFLSGISMRPLALNCRKKEASIFSQLPAGGCWKWQRSGVKVPPCVFFSHSYHLFFRDLYSRPRECESDSKPYKVHSYFFFPLLFISSKITCSESEYQMLCILFRKKKISSSMK